MDQKIGLRMIYIKTETPYIIYKGKKFKGRQFTS